MPGLFPEKLGEPEKSMAKKNKPGTCSVSPFEAATSRLTLSPALGY
jgi:hypothetical protein